MTVMGLDSRLSWLAWFFNTYLGMVLMSFIITALLTLGNQFKYSDPVLVFVFLATFSFSTTMMGYVAQKIQRLLLHMKHFTFSLDIIYKTISSLKNCIHSMTKIASDTDVILS